MKRREINNIYKEIKKIHNNCLKSHGIKFFKLKNKNKEYNGNALTLVYLFKNKGKNVSKKELTQFIRKFYPDINDVQYARHLSSQRGWNIYKSGEVKNSFYRIDDLTVPHSTWVKNRRHSSIDKSDFEYLKKLYNYKCTSCGSIEGKPHNHFMDEIVFLQKGHMNPSKSLDKYNTIPQCQICNRIYKNNFIFNKNGYIIGVLNEKFLKSSELNLNDIEYNI